MNRNLLALLALGESLARVPGPTQMLEALQRTSRQLFGQCHVHLVVLGLEGSICYQVSGPGGPAPSAGSSRDWLRAFPEVSAIWDKSSPQAVNAARLLGGGTSSGMALRLEDPAVPLGILALTGGDGPFSTEDLSLFCRMGDFTTLALQRWDRAGGGTARSLQRPDLLVLLAQEKERLEYVLRCLPIGLLLTDAEGVIAMANDAAAKALGLTDVELREKKIFGSRQAGRTVRGLIQKSLAEGKTVDTPYEMEGRWFQVEVIPWPGGQQYLLVTQDIHDWFQLNRLKEDLISIISHEVKNPLTAVLNAAHLLSSGRAGTLNEAQTRISVLVQENSQQIKRLLDDVVRLSRVYHLNVKTEPVALAPMVRAVHTRSAATMRGKLITWTESLEELTVRGETPMLDSLLVNLIGNAVKYTGIGGHVGVRLWSDGSRAILRVIDDGPGIPADERSRLFSPFFRASNVRDQVTGTGLGLVISRNIAERLGGSLTAVSPITPEDASFLGHVRAAAKGTAFQVELPLAR
jgi:PAS domain S-box-containing protein